MRFQRALGLLGDDYVLEWPQSNVRIRGRDNFATMNEEYPAHGRWQFTVNGILGDDHEVVSDVSVTDGVQQARVISFFTITDGMITKKVEFLPDKFAPRDDRKHRVEII